MRYGVRCGEDGWSRVGGRTLPGGAIVVLQTQGHHGQDDPPWQRIATSGGGEPQAQQGVHRAYVPYRLLRKQWPWSLRTMRRQTVKTQEMTRRVAGCDTRYRAECVSNMHQGDVPARSQRVARYLAT